MPTPNSDGPDISRWNPVANWDEIPQYRLFMTKATGTSTIANVSHIDPTFNENWQQMRRRNFEFRGCYHWLRSDISIIDQVELLNTALTVHGGLQAGEFVMLDWETTPNTPYPTVEQVEEWLLRAWVYWPGRIIVYCSDWVPNFVEWRTLHPEFPLWYANYNLTDPEIGGWAESVKWNSSVWQWTSSAPVPGINDPTCDMNHVLNWDILKVISSSKEPPMTRTYRWSYNGARLTEAELMTKWGWQNLHPEMRRRSIALANASQDAGHDLGFGEGARNSVQQLNEALRRHEVVSSGGCCRWLTRRYKLKPGMAHLAFPGNSNHDDDIFEGCALAVDFIGWEDHWFDANCERFGIKNFGGAIGPGVNGEEWHGQPLEIPNSRKDVNAYFANGGRLKQWPLPGETVPLPPPVIPPKPPIHVQKEVDMLILDLNPNTTWWVAMLLAGNELTHLVSGQHVAVLERGGVTRVTLNETELAGMLTQPAPDKPAAVVTTNDSPFNPALPSNNATLHGLWAMARQ